MNSHELEAALLEAMHTGDWVVYYSLINNEPHQL
jgi:hypothetical protein